MNTPAHTGQLSAVNAKILAQGEGGDGGNGVRDTFTYMKTQDAVGNMVERSIAQFHELEQRQPAQAVLAANEQTAEMAGPKLRA